LYIPTNQLSDQNRIYIKIMISIPKLVREKIQIYLDKIYQEKWQENIEIMHQQYKKYVHIEVGVRPLDYYGREGENVLCWKKMKKDGLIVMRKICILYISSTRHRITRFRVSQFTGKLRPKSKLPSKYYFSSGLNHLYAYK